MLVKRVLWVAFNFVFILISLNEVSQMQAQKKSSSEKQVRAQQTNKAVLSMIKTKVDKQVKAMPKKATSSQSSKATQAFDFVGIAG